MLAHLKALLAHLRVKLHNFMHKRHQAKAGGDRREKLAGVVQRVRSHEDKVQKKIAFLKSHRDPAPSDRAVTPVAPWNPEHHQIAGWIVPWLEKSAKAGWQGYVVSGYRSPAYSTSLCEAMCGAPTCPGRCAGATSNHSGVLYPAGAVDVDVAHRDQFAAIQSRIGSPLKNALAPADPNHFSVSGR